MTTTSDIRIIKPEKSVKDKLARSAKEAGRSLSKQAEWILKQWLNGRQ